MARTTVTGENFRCEPEYVECFGATLRETEQGEWLADGINAFPPNGQPFADLQRMVWSICDGGSENQIKYILVTNRIFNILYLMGLFTPYNLRNVAEDSNNGRLIIPRVWIHGEFRTVLVLHPGIIARDYAKQVTDDSPWACLDADFNVIS